MTKRSFTGPLAGLKVVEIGSIGPGPFCAMLLADLGADVIRVDRTSGAALVGPNADFRTEVMHRGRRSIAVDLKHPEGRDVVLELVRDADVLIEGFRPGVTERLGIGPDDCAAVNERLVYGRMTGYGQDGPMAQAVGHDLNYVAQSGVLALIGRPDQPPTPPLSLVGDFGGGGLVLALGVVSAVWEAQRSGTGQVVDAAMVDGSALLGAAFHGFVSGGTWETTRGANIVDSGAPFYDVYETADGKWLAVAAMEAHFYAELLEILDIDPASLPDQNDRARWPEMKKVFADAVRTRPRDEWVDRADGRGCVSAMLEVEESWEHPHNVARGTFVDVAGITQPSPQPRFSRTPAEVDGPPAAPGEHTLEALAAWGVPHDRIEKWTRSGAIAQTDPPSTDNTSTHKESLRR
ncbi:MULTISPECIES: CaiB/BaiF CoA transferase family protein [unclassified Nocardioides]|uniref:CaiB/BaiF CoA transferase family protein n=1 Tax=unclassified Nocardioides TaxID=2615069 RepID=UPI0006FFF7CD|nr:MULTISPECIES: CaiB/BaiF CoA-transferase family protein [unclassified Nocardioides]KQY50845.1 carnitine dehydratase [Nocardioides sp. Root140]KQZ75660.1 carnitine dehydratase [Nocardioides sp. Root151]KRF14733.1 carnitine dehydratase [Nocardioides sp. Soil796]